MGVDHGGEDHPNTRLSPLPSPLTRLRFRPSLCLLILLARVTRLAFCLGREQLFRYSEFIRREVRPESGARIAQKPGVFDRIGCVKVKK